MRSAVLLFAVLAFTVYSQLMIKARALAHTARAHEQSQWHYLFLMFTDIRVLSAIAAAFLAGACWMLTIQRLDVGYAYPFIALTFVLVPVGSAWLFGEPLPGIQLLSLAIIIVGVTVSALTR
jgi:multidrug transporter EmrE-like cation transporter